ncbi:hypothetical protein EYF80_028921 [Liparis tanakae]|uniref:Uncharacterized protein n=1 Tax=Liparis tanakae TaxID=230148 RepID=A0A4Z2H5E2_9TELE|nr:hypothetical protein EYF80_028921 [Liparis tanakae]
MEVYGGAVRGLSGTGLTCEREEVKTPAACTSKESYSRTSSARHPQQPVLLLLEAQQLLQLVGFELLLHDITTLTWSSFARMGRPSISSRSPSEPRGPPEDRPPSGASPPGDRTPLLATEQPSRGAKSEAKESPGPRRGPPSARSGPAIPSALVLPGIQRANKSACEHRSPA